MCTMEGDEGDKQGNHEGGRSSQVVGNPSEEKWQRKHHIRWENLRV